MTEGGWGETPHLFDHHIDELPVWQVRAEDFVELPGGRPIYYREDGKTWAT